MTSDSNVKDSGTATLRGDHFGQLQRLYRASSSVASPKCRCFFGGRSKILDFRLATVFLCDTASQSTKSLHILNIGGKARPRWPLPWLHLCVFLLRSRHSPKPIVVSCSQCLKSFLWKTASFRSCLSVSKGSSNDVASAAMTASVPSVSRLFLASAPLTLWIYRRTRDVKRLDADIIEPAQVIVVTQGAKKRLVIDYSVTNNRFTLLDAYPLPNIEDMVNRIARDKYFSSIDLSPSASASGKTPLHRLCS